MSYRSSPNSSRTCFPSTNWRVNAAALSPKNSWGRFGATLFGSIDADQADSFATLKLKRVSIHNAGTEADERAAWRLIEVAPQAPPDDRQAQNDKKGLLILRFSAHGF